MEHVSQRGVVQFSLSTLEPHCHGPHLHLQPLSDLLYTLKQPPLQITTLNCRPFSEMFIDSSTFTPTFIKAESDAYRLHSRAQELTPTHNNAWPFNAAKILRAECVRAPLQVHFRCTRSDRYANLSINRRLTTIRIGPEMMG